MGYPYGPESYPTIEMCEGKDVVDRISIVYGYECSKAEERKRQEAMARCNGDDCYVDTELTFAEQMKALGEAIGYVCDIDDCYDNRFITDLFNVLEDGVIGESDRQSINDYEIKDAAAGYARAKLDLTYPDKLGEYAKRLANENRGREDEERRKLIDETVEIMRRSRAEYVERATVRLVGASTASTSIRPSSRRSASTTRSAVAAAMATAQMRRRAMATATLLAVSRIRRPMLRHTQSRLPATSSTLPTPPQRM